jgi:hypothetical protein
MSRPASADLIASAFPVDRASLERAIDHFFEQLDGLNAREMAQHDPRSVIVLSLALASTFTALELVRRRWRRRALAGDFRLRRSAAGADRIGFPELPTSWSSRLS